MNLNLGQLRVGLMHLMSNTSSPEATWPHALLFASGNVAKQSVRRATDGSVAKCFEREALTRILDAQCDCVAGAHEGNFDIVTRVEMPSVLHNVSVVFPGKQANPSRRP